jgi:nucleoside-diphosphate-sugar epimerase
VKHVITGASGFIGSYLAEHLKTLPGNEVVSLGLGNPKLSQVRHVECDLRERGRVFEALGGEQPERVYHLAGSARVSSSIGMSEYYGSNVQTTENLAEALLASKVAARVFLSSSVHVYGNQTDLVDERSEVAPNGPYGFTKYLAERALERLVAEHPTHSIVVGRLYTCMGPGQQQGFVAADLAHKLARLANDGSAVLETGPLTALRRFLDVRDAVALISRLVEGATAERALLVNIASPFELSVRELVEKLVRVSNKKVQVCPQVGEDNPFGGIQLDTSKLLRLIPGFSFRPTESTLADIYKEACHRAEFKLMPR